MQQPAPTVDGTFRVLRTLHSIFLVSVILYIWAAEQILQHNQRSPDRGFTTAIVLLTAAIVVAAIVVRTKMIQPALDILQTKPDDKSSIVRWRTGSIISYALAETVVLFGLTLRILGATLAQSAPFYIAAVVLMVFFASSAAIVPATSWPLPQARLFDLPGSTRRRPGALSSTWAAPLARIGARTEGA